MTQLSAMLLRRGWIPLTATALAVALLGSGRAATQPERVKSELEEASAAYSRGLLDAARDHYRSALDASGGASVHAQVGLARVALRQQKFDEAKQAGDRLWEVAGHDAERAVASHLRGLAALGRARSLRTQPMEHYRELKEADENLRLAVNLSDGRLHAAWFDLAAALHQLDASEEAHRVFASYRTREPEKAASGDAKRLGECLDALAAEEWYVPLTPTEWNPVGLEPPQRLETPMPPFDGTDPGLVEVEILIRADGTVACAKPIRDSTRESGAGAAQALLDWRFRPAMLLGEPVAVRIVQPLRIGG